MVIVTTTDYGVLLVLVTKNLTFESKYIYTYVYIYLFVSLLLAKKILFTRFVARFLQLGHDDLMYMLRLTMKFIATQLKKTRLTFVIR